ncbi:hypothetical protein EHS25_000863 [Saitozyma podzolica]|uniref:Uncharacterized protein n=1 Tax=Saitozyma podzolica TaxID=1890683 RepID=A0A427YXG6_9TREE|nr:hypothetical protein EHS25_000863 [Saitozyma podzolica]
MHPPKVCLQRRFRRVARHEGAKHIMGQALASTPGTRVRLEPLGHQTSRRNDIQVFSLLGSQATGLANAEYDLTVVSLANKDARATKLPNQDSDPSRLVNKYLDSVADHKVRHRPTSNLPFHPIVLSLGGMMNGSTTKVFASWKRTRQTRYAPHAYAAASEAADTTLAPILTPGSLPDSTQLITQHQRCQEIFAGNKEALLGSLTPEQAKAMVKASSKLGRVWVTTIPFQPSLRLTDFEVTAALQLRTLAGEREAHCTNCGEANFFGHPEVCLQRKFRRVARHEGAKHIMGQALASTPGTRVRLEPLGHQTSRRNDIQVFSLLGSQATGLANAEYDLTVVSLANKDARATKLPNQDTDPSRLANKYLDSVADHKVRHRPTSNLPFHPIVFSLGGMMNGSTTKVFASWKRVMTRGTYNLMLKRLSLCLLQARVRSFEL